LDIGGRHYRSIWLDDDGWSVRIIDQTVLPHELRVARVADLESAARAIADMQVRGAPLIGATAAYGLALAARADPGDGALDHARTRLLATRPTAVNLRWALDRMVAVLSTVPTADRVDAAYREAGRIAEEDVARNRRLGEHGLRLIRELAERADGEPVHAS